MGEMSPVLMVNHSPHLGGLRTAPLLLLPSRDKITSVGLLLPSPCPLTWKTTPSSNESGFRVFGVAALGAAHPSARGPTWVPLLRERLHPHVHCGSVWWGRTFEWGECRCWRQGGWELLLVYLLPPCISVTIMWASKHPRHSE